MMNTVLAIRHRILQLCDERNMTINRLANLSAVPPSSVKNILYGKSQNPKIVTIKLLCDVLGITLGEFFDTKEFDDLEQEIK
jgi:transcriptional regulator with XRE-family HTH domain